jgi:PAS domain-containing protein
MQAKVAFLHTTDERFVVLSELLSPVPHARRPQFSVTTYDHENSFLALAATADLDKNLTIDIIATVLLSVAKPTFPHRWIDVTLNEAELKRLRLVDESLAPITLVKPPPQQVAPDIPQGFEWDGEQFYNFLSQAPTPFVMMEGPEHTVTFINAAYIRLIGRMTDEFVTGKPIREVLPELEGQPFFDILDRVYETGVAFIGVEAPATLKSEFTGEKKDCYFDFIYHPLRNRAGEVSGIMVQSSEVTERVLAREVTESRENQLYTQWLELEAIYNNAPVGLALFEAPNLKVIRINDIQAECMGDTVTALVGKEMKDQSFPCPEFKDLLLRSLNQEATKYNIITSSPTPENNSRRSWLVSITQFRKRSGEVERLSSISLEIPADRRATVFQRGA